MLTLADCSLDDDAGVYDFIFCDAGQERVAITKLARDGLVAVVGAVPDMYALRKLYVKLIPTFSGFNIPTTVTAVASRVPVPEIFGNSRLVYDGPACLHQFAWITACDAQRVLVCGSRWTRMVAAYKQQAGADWCKRLNFVAIRQ